MSETTAKPDDVSDKSVCPCSAQDFVNSGFELLNEIADGKVCARRTCLRCRIADILFEVQSKYLEKPNELESV
jgi:hypothetical protein